MPRRVLEGNVVSSKCDKTITVLVERRYMHPVYKKYIKSTDKYCAHDENNQFKEGDRVSIIECRPISKRKSWTVITGDEGQAPAKKADKKPSKSTAKETVAKKDEAKSEVKKKPAAKKKAPAKKAEAKKTTDKKTTAKKKDA